MKSHIALPIIPTTLKLLILKPMLLLSSLLLLLLLLFTFIPDLLLQDNAVHARLEERAHGGGFALEEPEAVEGHGGRRAGEVGDFFGELGVLLLELGFTGIVEMWWWSIVDATVASGQWWG